MDRFFFFIDMEIYEIYTILKALGHLPFNEVYELIAKIHEQANAQQQPPTSN